MLLKYPVYMASAMFFKFCHEKCHGRNFIMENRNFATESGEFFEDLKSLGHGKK